MYLSLKRLITEECRSMVNTVHTHMRTRDKNVKRVISYSCICVHSQLPTLHVILHKNEINYKVTKIFFYYSVLLTAQF